eukprot:scaffold1010_cov174-Isochrysis_galbana.AAC.1
MKLATSEEAAEMDGERCGIDGACCDSKGIFAAYASQVAGQPRPRSSPSAKEGQAGAMARRARLRLLPAASDGPSGRDGGSGHDWVVAR